MAKTKISIIVPVWNASETIERCVDSVLDQTLSDWELILSDDGSVDDSLAICQELAKKDSRICILANEHRGVSATRNAALDVARGEYICYVDADDTIDPDYLECLYAHREADMVVCGYWVDVYSNDRRLVRQEKCVQPERLYSFTQKKEMQTLFESGTMHINCNKLLKRDIIAQNHLRYKPYPVNEDFIFMMEYLLHCKSLYVVEKATYHWIRVENQQSGVESIPDNLIEIYNEAHLLLRKLFLPFKNVADGIMYLSYNLLLLKLLKNGYEKNKTIISKMHSNDLVSATYKAYNPNSIGESFFYWLLRLHLYKLYILFQKVAIRR